MNRGFRRDRDPASIARRSIEPRPITDDNVRSNRGSSQRPSRDGAAAISVVRLTIRRRSVGTGSSGSWARAGSGRSISLTTTTSTARSPSRCQTPSESPARGCRGVSDRSPHPRQAGPSPHRAGLRCGSHRRRALLRGLEVHRRERPGGQDRGQARPAFRESAELVATIADALALRPHPGPGPPRHQARQHPDRRLGQSPAWPTSGLPSRTRTSARDAGWPARLPT